MIHIPAPAAAALAKAGAAADMHPRAYRAILFIGGAALIWDGLRRTRRPQADAASGGR